MPYWFEVHIVESYLDFSNLQFLDPKPFRPIEPRVADPDLDGSGPFWLNPDPENFTGSVSGYGSYRYFGNVKLY